MALLETPAPQNGFTAPDFSLKGVDGKTYTFDNVKGENGTVVAFICNHCPYVQAIIKKFVHDAKNLMPHGINTVAIMPNDTDNYPEDSFENMETFATQHNFLFPYLIDETQDVAKAYDAVCTPDIFGFDKDGVLQYRGRLDSDGPNEATPDRKHELLEAMLQIAENGTAPAQQHPSMGCSIKWK